MKLAILIPTYNELRNIGSIIEGTAQIVPDADIYVIDDNSPDGTAQMVENLTKKFPQVKLRKRAAKLGLASAYLGAITDILPKNVYDYFLTIDADLSHHPKYIPDMLKEIKENDLVIGSRYVKGGGTRHWPLRRRFLSYFGNLYARTVLGLPFNDMTSGFMMFRANILERIDLDNISAEGYAFLIELKYYLYRAGARIAEVPIIFIDREHGNSKISSSVIREGLLLPWKIVWSRKDH